MSLQVWLPLNGNLENQGLSKITMTNNGAIVNNSGKIGKCYQFNGASNYLITDFEPKNIIPNEMSFCCWVKLNKINKIHTLFCSRIKTGAGLCLFILSSNKLRFDNMGDTNTDTYQTTFDPIFSTNQWYHIAVIQTSTHKKLYINGVLQQTIAKTPGSGTNTSSSNSATKATIGASGANNANDNWLEGYLNDVRIYNHALSDKEVKEISKGLILHYKLDNIVNPNLLIDSNAPSLTKVNATHNRYLEGASSGSYTVTFEELIDPPEIGIKYGVRQKNTSGSSMHSVTWYSGANVSVSAIPYTMSCYVKRISEETNLKIKFQYGKSPYKSTTLNIINDHEWHKYSWTFTPQTASGQAAASGTTKIYPGGLSVSPGEVLICGWKLEEGTTATSWILNPAEPGYNDLFNMYNTIYDSSGYGNNGTIYGTLTATDKNATQFNGSSAIIVGRNPMVKDEITLSCWGYLDNWNDFTGKELIGCTQSGGWVIGTNASGYLQLYMGIGTSSNTYKIITSINCSTISSGWHHFVGTYDGFISRLYLDGVELDHFNTGISTKTPIFYLTTNGIFIGAEAGTNTTTPDGAYFTGQMKNVRIYAKALSAEEVLELYNTAASIDSSGNVYARELVEE